MEETQTINEKCRDFVDSQQNIAKETEDEARKKLSESLEEEFEISKLRIAEGYMIDENGNDSGSLKENNDNNNRGMMTRSKSANQNSESIVSNGSNRGGTQ